MRVLLAGGGTGGHVYPAVTIAKALQEKGAQILFVGTQRGLEREIVPREGFDLAFIPVESFPRRLTWRLAKAGFTALAGFGRARSILRSFKPHVCIGTGGYVAGPVVLAAALERIPTVVQEQNALPGVTNRILARFVDKLALGYEAAKDSFGRPDKLVVTGNPIRPEIVQTSRAEGAHKLGLNPRRRNVLIFGASQGARTINQAVIDGYDALMRHDAHYILVTGERGYDETLALMTERGHRLVTLDGSKGVTSGNLRLVPYMYEMAAALASADLVVGRAGALSISEITARGLPSILIPFPHAAENHQEVNARVLEEAGAARMILDRELTGPRLADAVGELLGDRETLQKMGEAATRLGRPDAVWDIVALIEGVVTARSRR